MKPLMKKELITVRHVAMHCSEAIQNLKAVVAGQAFMSRSAKKALFTQKIIHLVCAEPKYSVAVVKHT